MKGQYKLLLLVPMALSHPMARTAGQNTGYTGRPWSKDGLNPVIDTLRNVVLGDTLATGARKNLNRVYKLQKGGLYWLAGTGSKTPRKAVHFRCASWVKLLEPLTIRTPLIQLSRTATGGAADSRMITGLTDVTLKGLYITGREDGGAQTRMTTNS